MPIQNHRNPTRRNRNIGTARQGHGQDNRFVLPESADAELVYWAALKNPKTYHCQIGKHRYCVLEEPTRRGYAHACGVEDIEKIFRNIPEKDRRDVAFVILRQPRKKEEILYSVWGRILYWLEMGQYAGAAIVLCAMIPDSAWEMRKSLTPPDVKEIERLKRDGHVITPGRRGNVVTSSLKAIRNTQLFGTVPHEVGHLVDAVRNYEGNWVSATLEQRREYLQNYHSTQTREDKEAFAHIYADKIRKQMNNFE